MFAGRIANGIDMIDGDWDPWDNYGHGTHIAGTAAGTKFGGQGRHHPPREGRGLGDDGAGSSRGLTGSPTTTSVCGGCALPRGPQERGPSTARSSLIDQGVTVVVAPGAVTRTPASSPQRAFPQLTVSATDRNDVRPRVCVRRVR